jgi:hypothetical protein
MRWNYLCEDNVPHTSIMTVTKSINQLYKDSQFKDDFIS